MVCVYSVEVCPCMDYVTLLQVELGEVFIQLFVPAAFITVALQEDTGMIGIGVYHFTQQLYADFIVVASVPACKLIQIKKT